MDEAIRELLDALEKADAEGAPLTDGAIREALLDVVRRGFIEPEPAYRVPEDLLMDYSEDAARHNAAVVAALERFVKRARALGPATPEERQRAFFDGEVLSSSGDAAVDSFFG